MKILPSNDRHDDFFQLDYHLEDQEQQQNKDFPLFHD
jgi:hypothetical protein